MKPPVEEPTSSATAPGHVPAEMVERMGELDPAPRDPGMVLAPHLERRVGGERLPGLVDLALAGEDQAGEDQRLRLRPAFGEPAVDEQLIGADLDRHRPGREFPPEHDGKQRRHGHADEADPERKRPAADHHLERPDQPVEMDERHQREDDGGEGGEGLHEGLPIRPRDRGHASSYHPRWRPRSVRPRRPRRHFISGWMRVPKFSVPAMKSSKVEQHAAGIRHRRDLVEHARDAFVGADQGPHVEVHRALRSASWRTLVVVEVLSAAPWAPSQATASSSTPSR